MLYSGGVMSDLGTLGGSVSIAYGINDSGQVVGDSSYLAGNAPEHAFLYSGGVMSDLNSLLPSGSNWTLESATAINNEGQIVGYGIHNGATHAFLLDLSEIAPTSLVWNTTGGGVDYSYQISGGALSEPTTIQLDWASGTTVNTIIGDPIVSTTTATAQGTYDLHATPAQLGTPPQGAKYLLLVTDPGNTLNNFDATKNVLSLELPDLNPNSFQLDQNATDGGGVDFSLVEDGLPLPEATTASVYWADGPSPSDTLEPIGQPVWSENVPAGDLGDSPLVYVDASALGTAPVGTTYLMVVADPSNRLERSGSDVNYRSIHLTPEVVLSFSVHPLVAQPSKHGPTAGITATFDPANGALTLADAASILGVSHFNWVQYITQIPSQWQYYDVTNGHETPLDPHPVRNGEETVLNPPILDPVRGYPQHMYVVKDRDPHINQHRIELKFTPSDQRFFGDNNLPYYNEPDGVLLIQSVQFPTLNHQMMLGFGDSPSREKGWFGPKNKQYMGFMTTLVGISKNGAVKYFPNYGQTLACPPKPGPVLMGIVQLAESQGAIHAKTTQTGPDRGYPPRLPSRSRRRLEHQPCLPQGRDRTHHLLPLEGPPGGPRIE